MGHILVKMKNIISRFKVRKKLEAYAKTEISLNELIKWAENVIKSHLEFNDWEGDDSFVNEVITRIDMGDIDGLTIVQANKIIELLKLNEKTKILTKKLYKLK